ncbi:MAG: DUF1800 family protein [Verrucomicrobiia bacterium]
MRAARTLLMWLVAGLPLSGLAGEGGVRFPVESMRLPVGQTRIIALRVEVPSEVDRRWEALVQPAGRVEILREPEVLAGQAMGFVRVRMVSAGAATLTVGGARLSLLGVTGGTTLSEPPEVVSPVSGAHVWGEFSVAVEWVPLGGGDGEGTVELRSASGERVRPDEERRQVLGWGRREVFLVDASRWKEAQGEWTPVVVDGKGQVLASGRTVRWVRAEFGKEGDLADECEHHLEGTGQERFGEAGPPTAADEGASGGVRVNLVSGRPVWTLKTEVRETGWFQLMLRSRADEAAGTLPTVGVYVDDGERTVANGRLAEPGWHRVAVGLPFKMEAGERRITVQFRNDFASGRRVDRNLFLDRFELARVEGPAQGGAGFSVGFGERLDGREVLGAVEIFGRARWPDHEREAMPRIELWINGKLWGEQRGGTVRFDVPVTAWRPGANRVELRARSPLLGEVRSEVQVVRWAGQAEQGTDRTMTFTALDERWEPGMEQRWEASEEGGPLDAAAFYTNGEAVLRLPETLKGRFRVVVEGRGQEFEGAPEFRVALRRGEVDQELGTVALEGALARGEAGVAELAGGAQGLVLTFHNDRYREKQGDRNIWLQRVVLVEEGRGGPGRAGPRLEVAHPQSGAVISRQGLVLLRAEGVRRGDVADVMVGDRVVATVAVPQHGLGPWFVAFGDRRLPEGPGKLRAVLRRGGEVVAQAKPIEVEVKMGSQDSAYDRAVHLLNRFAYGPEPALVAEVLAEGEQAWLERRLMAAEDGSGTVPRRRNVARRGRGRGQVEGALAWVQESDNPVRARFVFWVQNHFSVWGNKVGAESKGREHERFVRLGVASFPELLAGSMTSPAMLFYLDQHRSFAGRLNENYARELLELHTVGVRAGYTQEDVTALARLLTGWTLAEEGDLGGVRHDLVRVFRFEPRLNSGREERVFGLRVDAVTEGEEQVDRIRQVLEMLALHPSTAEFVCRKLVEHYVGAPACPELVGELSRVFLEQGGEMVPVLLRLADHPTFWASAETRRMATPFDFGVRMSRMLGGGRAPDLGGFLRRSGMGLFDRATPDGYPELCASWTDSNALLQRWRWAGQLPSVQIPSDLLERQVELWTEEDRQRAVDAAAMRVNGRLLSDRSNEALMSWLKGRQGAPRDVAGPLGAMLIRLPETHLR